MVTRKINLNHYIDQLRVWIPNVWSQFLWTQLRSQILSTSISTSTPNTDLLNFDSKCRRNHPKYWTNSSWTSNPNTDAIPNTDLIRRFPNTLKPITTNIEFIGRWASKISTWDWQKMVICCVLCFHTLSTQWLQILNLFGIVFSKY